MAVQIQQPTRQKRDVLDYLLGGLQAAGAYTNIQKARAEMEQIPEARARQQRAEEQSFALNFQQVPEQTQGATQLTSPQGEQGLYLPRAQIIAKQKAEAELEADKIKQQADAQRLADERAFKISEAEKERTFKSGETAKQIEQKQKELNIKLEDDLRNEWLKNPQTKVTQEVSAAVEKIRTVGKGEPSAAGDMSLIFSYMKLLDPGSTVREGEFANAQNAEGIPGRIMNLYNQARNGERLNPDQRKDFVNRAEQLYDVHWQKQKAFNDEIDKIAKGRNLESNKIVLDLGFAPKKTSLVPQTKSKEDLNILNQNLERYNQLQEQNQQGQYQGPDNLNQDLQEFRQLLGQ